MKKYVQPIVIGLIAGVLPTLFGYSINTYQWWILMPIFSFMIWLMIKTIKYIINEKKK